jgi:hypothetical protein
MNKFFLVLPAIILHASAILAQSKAELEVIAQVREEGFQNSQVAEISSYVSDVFGNRLSGSKGIGRAQVWTMKQMESIALENVIIESVMDHGKLYIFLRNDRSKNAP